jgi:hypothetical protein
MHRCNRLVQYVYMHIYGKIPTEGSVRTYSPKTRRRPWLLMNPIRYDGAFSDPIPQNVTGLLPTGERHVFSALATRLI